MAYVLRRVAISIGLIWTVATLIFLVLRMIPGDPAELLLSSGGVAPDPAQVLELRERLGLEAPLLQQYATFMGQLLRLDLGTSLTDDYPVMDEIAKRLPRTIELILAATILAVAVGMPLGVVAALRRGSGMDRTLSAAASFNQSLPVFVTGTLLILVFAQHLRWVPAGGYVAFAQDPARHLTNLLMPAVTIAIGLSTVVFRMTRASVLETLDRDWVRTARAKGLAPRHVVRRHVLRNSLGPVVTVIGLQMGTLLGGTVLVEYVFNWPGLSGYLVRAVEQRNYPEVQGIVLVICALFVFLNLVVDLLYAVLDPRVRHG
ncbi:MAG: ABC transporter permease [Alphaproteobacteria bacterium]|nr:ABC transporter permease [Alphaproteobacteria bacterium]